MEFDRDIAHIACGAALMFAVMLGIHLRRQRRKDAMMRMFFGAMVLFALMLVKDILGCAFGFEGYCGWAYVSYTLELFWIPVILAFNFSILAPRWRRSGFLFIPFVLLMVINLIWHTETVYHITLLFAGLFAVAGMCITFAVTVRYNRYVKENYSDVSHKAVTWVRGVNFIFIFWYAFSAAAMTFYEPWYVDVAKYMTDIAVWAVVYFYSIRHQVIEDVPNMLSLNFSRRSSAETPPLAVPEPQTDTLMCKIRDCFETKQIYRTPALTINDVAAALNSNRTYISRAINGSGDVTFFQFVNRYRIQYATKLMNEVENNKFTLENIARQSGFTSLTPFYTFFKKEKGCTPGEFLRKKKNSV